MGFDEELTKKQTKKKNTNRARSTHSIRKKKGEMGGGGSTRQSCYARERPDSVLRVLDLRRPVSF